MPRKIELSGFAAATHSSFLLSIAKDKFGHETSKEEAQDVLVNIASKVLIQTLDDGEEFFFAEQPNEIWRMVVQKNEDGSMVHTIINLRNPGSSLVLNEVPNHMRYVSEAADSLIALKNKVQHLFNLDFLEDINN